MSAQGSPRTVQTHAFVSQQLFVANSLLHPQMLFMSKGAARTGTLKELVNWKESTRRQLLSGETATGRSTACRGLQGCGS